MSPVHMALQPSLETAEILLEVFLIQGAVLVVLFFLNRVSAATQHLLLSASVIMVLTVVLASPLVPSRSLGILPVARESVSSWSGPAEADAGRAEEPSVSAAGRVRSAPMPVLEAADDRTDVGGAGSTELSDGLLRTLGLLWALGSFFFLARLAWGLAMSWRLSSRSRSSAAGRSAGLLSRAARAVGLPPRVALAESEEVRIPMVFGFLRPRVILPAVAAGWPEARLKAVLLHESAHVRRRDLVFQLLAKLACALFWFNPLAWLVERKLFLASEKAADDQVIGQDVTPSDYAEHLMDTSEELGTARNPVWATVAMAEGTAFKERILSILDPNMRRGEPAMSHRSLVLVSAAFLAVPFLAFSPWTATSDAEATRNQSARLVAARMPDEPVRSVSQQGVSADFNTLLAMLQMSDAGMREHAATALAATGKPQAVLPLVDVAMNDDDAKVREHACSALGSLGDERAVLPLLDVMRTDPNPVVREHAASAVGQLRDARAFDLLLDMMHGRDEVRVRAHAAEALGTLGDSRALEPLLGALLDESAVMRSHAALGLGELGDSRARDALTQALRDADEQVRRCAAEALGKM